MRRALLLMVLAALVVATASSAHTSDAQAVQGPANGAVFPSTTTIVLEYDEPWFCTDCAGTASFKVARDPNLTDVVDSASGPCPPGPEPSCPTWSWTGPLTPGTYYWAYVASFANGEEHRSDVWSFTVSAPGSVQAGSYADPSGDGKGSPDITNVEVSYDPPTGQIRVLATIPGFQRPATDERYELFIDADQDASTGGEFGGADHYLTVRGSDNTFGFYSWDGDSWEYSPSETQSVLYRNGLLITLNRRDLGGNRVGGFNFWVQSRKGTGDTATHDYAPDASLWNFQLPAQTSVPATPPSAPAVRSMTVKTLPVAPTAGLPFRVVPTVTLTTGARVTPDKLACSALIGKARVRGSGAGRCTLAVPRTAAGKVLVVRVVAGYKGSTTTRTLRYKVRRA